MIKDKAISVPSRECIGINGVPGEDNGMWIIVEECGRTTDGRIILYDVESKFYEDIDTTIKEKIKSKGTSIELISINPDIGAFVYLVSPPDWEYMQTVAKGYLNFDGDLEIGKKSLRKYRRKKSVEAAQDIISEWI
jgi:hypothetical protein